MYKNGEAALDRILELVARCPKELQEICFEALLSGYVQIEAGTVKPHAQAEQTKQSFQADQQTLVTEPQIPQAVLTRLKNTAKRLGITLQKQRWPRLFGQHVPVLKWCHLSADGYLSMDQTRGSTGSWRRIT